MRGGTHRTAFLIDGGFFQRRYRRLRGDSPPAAVARALHQMCLLHFRKLDRPRGCLYRIFYYDCPPLAKKAHNPITGRAIDFSKTASAAWRMEFLNQLCKLRKVALCLGYLDERNGHRVLKPGLLKKLADGNVAMSDLDEASVKYEVRQKGVDMRIGLDIASMAYKRQVDQLVLVSGDSDFVSAAKLARREGIDLILDPMWATVRDDLFEHIDGLQSAIPKAQAGSHGASGAPGS